jgi:LTXXQ motif family protein
VSIEENYDMTRNGKFILAGVTAVTIGVAAAGAYAARGDGKWGHHGWGHHRGGQMGFMGLGGFGGPMGRICRGDPSEMTDHMLVRIEHKVKPTDAQKGAFEELKTAARSAAEKIKAGCPKDVVVDKDAPKPVLSPIERLSRTQTQLEASLEAVKTVRPAAEKFYVALNDEQKAKLNEHRGWRGKRGDKGRDGPGDDGDGPAEKDATPQPPAQE